MSSLLLNVVAKDQKLVQDHKRERDHKYKWAHGEAMKVRGRSSKRPAKLTNPGVVRAPKPGLEYSDPLALTKVSRKHNSRFDNDTSTSDSSAEEDVKDVSSAPEPDAGISYSFDAQCGPTEGGQILSMALAKAVEKFEIRATEKLVKEEYEVVGIEKDDFHDGYNADEDDYELV
ncbi:hypothetical protein MMC07_005658 [Pseudocyphellaria aurata]|nr:hypothetical protein [Pseudocyphellaria aurata]